jgi:hypothetical protein
MGLRETTHGDREPVSTRPPPYDEFEGELARMAASEHNCGEDGVGGSGPIPTFSTVSASLEPDVSSRNVWERGMGMQRGSRRCHRRPWSHRGWARSIGSRGVFIAGLPKPDKKANRTKTLTNYCSHKHNSCSTYKISRDPTNSISYIYFELIKQPLTTVVKMAMARTLTLTM